MVKAPSDNGANEKHTYFSSTKILAFLPHYLRLGFGLVHVPTGTKGPRITGWQDHPITTPEEAAKVWRHGGGIGLHHGVSRTAVLDIDYPEWAALALAAVDIDLAALLNAPGPKIRGAKGLKPVYLLPDGLELKRHALAWKEPESQKAVTLFELRAGLVQDVLPPSLHPDTGKPYTWEPAMPQSRDEIPELPGRLLALWQNWGVLKPILNKSQPWAAPPPPRTYQDTREGGSVIAAFNKRYTFTGENILERHGYIAKGTDRWLSPHSSSGLAGVVLLEGDDGLERVYCHHAADPLGDGHAHDAFSVWLMLEHGGDMKAAVKEAAKALGMSQQKPQKQTRAKPTAKADTPTDERQGDVATPEDDTVTAGDYADKGNVIYRRKTKMIKEGKEWREEVEDTALCNFSARITEERERDDGVERTLTLVISGTLATGQPLPSAEVTASQFASLGWAVSEWGSRAVVYAGQGTKDHLRAALQMLSGDVPRRTTYTHLGWRELGGRMVYLHAGGTLAAAPLVSDAPVLIPPQVEPPGGLEAFTLPDAPTGNDLKKAVSASLATLDLAPDGITVPLLGMTYRAVLGSVDFGGHLAGQTGAGKSELAAVMQQHFGAGLDSRHLPGSWSSTANALEGLAFAGKDVLITVDDFAPEGSSYDIQRYHATAARLFRAQGNNAARGRMRADGSLRPNKPPRGLILSTGEDIPKGHSIKARTLILELEPHTLNWQRLTQAQKLASAGVYGASMSGFIVWLAHDYDNHIKTFRTDYASYREQLQSTGHKRTVDAGAQLLATYRSLLTFALEVGTLTETEHAALWQRLENGMQAALEPQAALQAHSDPVARFSELLTGLFVSGRAHVADANSSAAPGDGWGWEAFEASTQYGPELRHRAKGNRIGWVDSTGLYLEPSATYAELQRFARDQGDSVPIGERTLWKRLNERGMILSREEPHLTVKRSFEGAGRVRVLHLSTSTLSRTGASGATGVEPVQDSVNPRPTTEMRETELGQMGQHELRQVQHPGHAPQTSGAAQESGVQKSMSDTARTPLAPVAPQNTGVETATQRVSTAANDLSHLLGTTKGEL